METIPAHDANGAALLLTLFVMFAAAKLLAEVFERLRQPGVAGEILAGVLIGPACLNWVQPSTPTDALAEFGVMFLLFGVGLETKPAALLRVGRTAATVAVLGVLVPFVAGWALLRAWHEPQIEALFVGAAMVATSVGITARVLSAMDLLDTAAARIILGAAVIDDVLGLLVLAAVASVTNGSTNWLQLGITAALAIGFVLLIAFLGAPMVTRAARNIGTLRIGNALFAVSVLACLGLALAASAIGVAAIIGAFLAGLALAEATEHEHDLHQQVRGVTEFLTPFFLVNIGMQLKLHVLADTSVLMLALCVTLAAVATKLIGCGLGALSLGLRGAAQVGIGMVPRGEVGIVVAQLGLGLGVISDRIFAVVLFMAVATTMIAPPLIRPLFAAGVAKDGEGDPQSG
jgi:Kef-type K+ transport system membrane component KefB